MSKKKIILLTSDHSRSKYLAQRIAAEGLHLDAIVIEGGGNQKSGADQPKDIKSLIRTLMGQELYTGLAMLKQPKEVRRVFRLETKLRIKAEKQLKQTCPEIIEDWPNGIQRLNVPNINDDSCVQYCRQKQPDLVCLFATSIAREPILKTPKIGVLNAHTSLLPDYKGTFVEFWQLYHGDFNKVGITIHFVDQGIDTGDIIFQMPVHAAPDSDPFQIRTKNTIEILTHYPPVIKNILKGQYSRKKQTSSSIPTFTSKDLSLEKKIELYKKLGLY